MHVLIKETNIYENHFAPDHTAVIELKSQPFLSAAYLSLFLKLLWVWGLNPGQDCNFNAADR